MKEINFKQFNSIVLPNEVINLISKIHEHKGKQDLFFAVRPDVLEKLVEIAKIHSTDYSNRIEGIRTSGPRLKALLEKKVRPKNRAEEEIAGYRTVLDLIHVSYESIPITKNQMLWLHKELYSFTGLRLGGMFKITDNYIEEINDEGVSFIRFKPVQAFMTNDYIDNLCSNFTDTISEGKIDPLILIPCFILDFLCIHPFNDGNGRMSRLLTLLLLYKYGYHVGKYISLEKIIEETKEGYYLSLQDSSVNWHENSNNYIPFMRYTLGVILKAYTLFEERYNVVLAAKAKPYDRVFEVIANSFLPLSRTRIMELCPEISQRTIERALAELQADNKIVKTGAGKNTNYTQVKHD